MLCSFISVQCTLCVNFAYILVILAFFTPQIQLCRHFSKMVANQVTEEWLTSIIFITSFSYRSSRWRFFTNYL